MRSNTSELISSVEAEMNENGDKRDAWEVIIQRFWAHVRQYGVANFSASTEEWESTDFPKLRMRVNCFLDSDGVSLVVRLLNDDIPQLTELGFDIEAVQRIQKNISRTSGLILVTGPTGSGKTTTLGSIINEINLNKSSHIITIEDPIEFKYRQYSPLVPNSEIYQSLITQREVYVHCNNFRDGLNDALRQDPNIILVGECRTRETLEAALVAAETGHLVLSTLHTNGGYQTINRIISEFPIDRKEFICKQLAGNLLGIISQRLLLKQDQKGRVLCYEYLEMNGGIKSALMESKPERIPNSMTPENSIKWNTNLKTLFEQGLISEDVYTANRMSEQD
jgi:twitching motility protein PilT